MATPTPVVCLHHAGGSGTIFRAWSRVFDARGVELIVLSLPGRAQLYRDTPLTEPGAAIAWVAAQLKDLVGDYHLFGHSLGGQLAYRVAEHAYVTGELTLPRSVQVSAARASLSSHAVHASDLSDDTLIALLKQLDGAPDDVIANEAWRSVALPLLRNDLTLSRSLAILPLNTELPVPLTAHAGRDDSFAPPSEVAAWQAATSAFDLQLHDGGHFYLRDAPDDTARAVLDAISSAER